MHKLTSITGIMACDPTGLIGQNGKMPWKNADETEHFRQTTNGHVAIMGHTTFKSYPPHNNTFNIVFSRKTTTTEAQNTIFVRSIKEFKSILLPKNKKIFMIGGAEIAHLFLKHCLISEFVLTKMKQEYSGDVFLNLNLLQNWKSSVLIEHEDYTIYRLTQGEQS